jgi:hypothetical protein
MKETKFLSSGNANHVYYISRRFWSISDNFKSFRIVIVSIKIYVYGYKVDPRVTTGLTYEQLGLQPKF